MTIVAEIVGGRVQGHTFWERRNTVEWKATIAQVIPIENRLFHLVRGLFKKQFDQAMEKVRKMRFSTLGTGEIPRIVPGGGIGVLVPKSMETKLTDQEIDFIVNAIFPKDKWQRIWERTLMPFMLVSFEPSGQKVFNDTGLDLTFNQRNPFYREAIQERTIKFSGLVNGETRKRLNELIKPILQRGGSTDTVRKNIQKAVRRVFKNSARGKASRARMIARTEATSAHNAASLSAMRASGVVSHKRWITSRDARVRPSHRNTENQTVPVESLFMLVDPETGEKEFLDHPGDSSHGATAKNIVNCRCVVVSSRGPR